LLAHRRFRNLLFRSGEGISSVLFIPVLKGTTVLFLKAGGVREEGEKEERKKDRRDRRIGEGQEEIRRGIVGGRIEGGYEDRRMIEERKGNKERERPTKGGGVGGREGTYSTLQQGLDSHC
jgi:hypothetical protein